MTEVAKHKAQRSVSRMIGQYLDAQGKVAGGPTECQTAFPFVHVRRTKSAAGDPIDNPHFALTVKVPKLTNDPATCPNYAGLAAHCMEAATKAWGSWPAGGKWPIQDGDVPYPQKLKPGQTPLTAEQIAERNKWRTGHWVIEATNYLDEGPRVAIVANGTEQAITSQTAGGSQLYKSGDFGFPFISAYTFHNKTFGVNFSLEGVCFTRACKPEEKIGGGGRRSVQSMFGGVGAAVGAGMATAQPPGPPDRPRADGSGRNCPDAARRTHGARCPACAASRAAGSACDGCRAAPGSGRSACAFRSAARSGYRRCSGWCTGSAGLPNSGRLISRSPRRPAATVKGFSVAAGLSFPAG
jgi:hypothetical protein